MAVTTAAGTSISIGTSAEASESDTYTLIGEVVNIPAFGKQFQEVTHLPLGTRETQKFKGSFNSGSVELQLGMDLEDAGQADLLAALESDEAFNFKVVLPTGHIRYFKARVMSYNETIGGTDSIVGATATLSIIGSITRADPTP